MPASSMELIRARKSVRTFQPVPLREEDLKALEAYTSSLSNPFGVPVTFRILSASEHGLSSPVIVGADTYVAAKVQRVPGCEMAYGYSFEKFCLYALSLGIGTVMLAASLSRAAFEKAMDVREGEVMPVASPVGYPAQKPSIREGLLRKGLKADGRKPFESLFFDGPFERGLTEARSGIFRDALEAARWAPSAGNQQPWRAVLRDGKVHFFEAKTMRESPLGDVQKVDVGIALSHFDMVLEEMGIRGQYVVSDPNMTLPEHTEYLVTFEKTE
ncbi:MAG: nitroreductase [Clostridia bacterium]|nr:nitroreductase [Clostridia bacterium]